MLTQSEINVLLNRMAEGDLAAESQLVPHLYGELHNIAARCLRNERPDHTLQPTALVHEAFLRLTAHTELEWRGRSHFFATSAHVMRQVLTDYARQRNAIKRGGAAKRVELHEAMIKIDGRETLVLDLNTALCKLEGFAPRQAKVVEMRFFAGMSIDDIAENLGITSRTVNRDWQIAKAWLLGELAGSCLSND